MNPAAAANVQSLLLLCLVISLQLFSILVGSTSLQAQHSIRKLKHATTWNERRGGSTSRDSTLDLTVKQDGTGHYTTVQAAVNAVSSSNQHRVVIQIFSGTYLEKLEIESSKPFITLKGVGTTKPIISWKDNATTSGSTWKSSTVAIDADYFIATNIVFRNTAPAPPEDAEGGQAIAVRVSGDKAAFYNCHFLGEQDTLCDMEGRHFFKNCFIQGSVDFIFGNGQSIYTGCWINTVATHGFGSVAAQSRDSVHESTGYSFIDCTVTGTGSAVYLGRAWGDASRVVFSSSRFSSIVDPRGWNDWRNPSADRTVYFGEYNNSGPGANLGRRVSYTKSLTAAEAKPFLDLSFIDGDDWLDPDLY